MKQFLLGIVLALHAGNGAAVSYQQPAEFLADVFGTAPAPKMLWMTATLRDEARAILGHDLGVLRLRYWGLGNRTAWIMDEIGKEQPITVGLAVDNGKLERVKVLEFRESRGFEVKSPAFTRQYNGAALTPAHGLDRTIDGITGATLSVSALTRLARLVLLLHQHTAQTRDAP